MPSLSPKSVSGNEIFSGKADSFAPCMIPKPTFVEEVDDNDNDINFEYTSRICIISIGNNQTY